MTTKIRFWVDPICPWCWVTAMWVREVAAERDLEISWQPISLFIKNDPSPESSSYGAVRWTYELLRVMEAVRVGEGEAAVESLYVEYGRRIHHDGERIWDPAIALEAVGLDPAYASAATDEQWDAPLRERMNAGLELVGNDVGTPIIAFVTDDGRDVAAFGPVITKVPETKDALALWDAFATVTALDEFWEIKRTRTRRPEFGPRP